MSLENRSSSALFKRAEQLKRWEQSDTNREPPHPKHISKKIKFSADCVFLAACAAGDKDEVIRLIQKGADINTGNVDGLTALHQACIDDDLDMVEFLVKQGADIDRGDNEGWTPLHATASCGFISIAKYLIEQGCNLAAVNNDGELAVDIAESDDMEELLQEHISKAGIDCDQARSEEERLMLNDAKAWRSGAPGKDAIHPRSGATALHVAAAKGYIKVINILLQANCDVNAIDNDGWTPLHAAAHWGQVEACKLLVENFCDMDIKNYAGQTAFDVADTDILKSLEELKKKQEVLLKDRPQIINKQPPVPKKRSTNKDAIITDQDANEIFDEETPNKLKKVELEIQSDKEESNSEVGADNNNMDVEASEDESESSSSTSPSDRLTDDEKKNRANRGETATHNNPQQPPTTETIKVPGAAPVAPPKQQTENNEEGNIPSWRRSGSFRNRITESEQTKIEDQEKPVIKVPGAPHKIKEDSEVVLRRTHSFETDEKKKDLNLELSRLPQDKASSPVPTPTPGSVISPIIPSNQIRRSFVPPVRDEESETQRKAHAKRVRETRRSTQGVTLDEIKSAEQLVKKKQQQNNDTTSPTTPTPSIVSTTSVSNVTASITATITTTPSTTITANKPNEESNLPERRPSWRLKVDGGSKFQLEDANNKTPDTTTAYIRRTAVPAAISRSSSAPVENVTASTAEASLTIPLRRQLKPPEDKEQDKENDSRNAQATQAVIQRRRRPKRRSTGVVHVDMDEIDPDKQENAVGAESDDVKLNHNESGHERSDRSSRLGSVSSLNSETSGAARTKSSTTENGEVDYKKLYEESQAENERIREKLRKSDEQLKEVQSLLEKAQVSQTKTAVTEAEKRERRAMERKLSEMEEELKILETIKSENQKLKDENGALIRVVSKLSK